VRALVGVGWCRLANYPAITDTQICQLMPSTQLESFMVSLDESSYGVMEYEVFSSMLAEWETIVLFAIASCRVCSQERAPNSENVSCCERM
jgi:hypothetical protein